MKNLISPTIFIIFGVTGDLASKKIIPSLWHLFCLQRLPSHFAVIGFSRREFSNDEFQKLVREAIEQHGGVIKKEEDFILFFKFFSYHTGTFENEKAFYSLSKHISEIEMSWGVCTNKLFYLATPPLSYNPIFKNLAAVKLNISCGGDFGWSRILIEKPFGSDLASAQVLQSLLSLYFKETQIYRIDHYLFKEIIQGIKNFRFSNNLFEDRWDNTQIERIDIRLYESIGAENRGNFYDSVGALRDVGQNHLLAMLSAITMEYPPSMNTSDIRKNRADILKMLPPWNNETLKKNTFRAQYRGYQNIKGVHSNSEIETYFALKTELIHPRWRGIPIFMESGKRMDEARKEIVVTLKHPKDCLLCRTGHHASNAIVFRLEPNDEVVIHFWTKKIGFEQILEERVFSFFLYEKKIKTQYVEEYAKLIYAAIDGNRSFFISPEEVEAAWKFTDPIINGWKNDIVPLVKYNPDTTPSPVFLFAKTERIKANIIPSACTIGIIGLGKMGGNIARRLLSKQWKVVGFDNTPDTTKKLVLEGMNGVYSLREFVDKIPKPRTIWLMVPYQIVDEVLAGITHFLEKGDVIIDGGNSPYKESMRRNKELAQQGISFLDVGVSGGPGGAINGSCLMIGGDKKLYKQYEPLFKDLSVQDGYGYMGLSGAGHFVKMVHNGIEYGMMQSIAEGFTVMKQSSFKLNLGFIAELYNHGSVIESSLVDWLSKAYAKFTDKLNMDECCSGKVSNTGEGQWTVATAKELNVPVAIIEGALEFRKQSQKNPSYTGKILSALRHQFGGHNAINK